MTASKDATSSTSGSQALHIILIFSDPYAKMKLFFSSLVGDEAIRDQNNLFCPLYKVHGTLHGTRYITHYTVQGTWHTTLYKVHDTLHCTRYMAHYTVQGT